MNPLRTQTDVSFGWVVVGLSLIAAGWLYLNLGPKFADAIRKLWLDHRAPAKADRYLGESESDRQQRLASQPFAPTLDAGGAEYERAERLARLIADNELQVMARVVGMVDSNPSNVVPMQRRGGSR